MIARGSSTWSGPWHEGTGTLATASGSVAGVPYSYASRFEDDGGASPEELLAAAYAGCLNQAFANTFGWGNFTAERIETTVEVEVALGRHDGPPGRIHVTMRAVVAGIEPHQFIGLTNAAKAGCLVSRLLGVEATMDAQLVEVALSP